MNFYRCLKTVWCVGVFVGCGVLSVLAMEGTGGGSGKGGGSGTFGALPAFDSMLGTTTQFIPRGSSGVKFYKKAMDEDAALELDFWKQIRANYAAFISELGRSGTVTGVPAWWRDGSPVAQFVFKKDDSIASVVVEKINEIWQKKFAKMLPEEADQYDKKAPMWLLMENLSRPLQFTPKIAAMFRSSDNRQELETFIDKVLVTVRGKDNTKPDDSSALRIAIYKKIGEGILLLFCLGFTGADSDSFVTFDKSRNLSKDATIDDIVENISVKFIDFAENMIFARFDKDGKINPITSETDFKSFEDEELKFIKGRFKSAWGGTVLDFYTFKQVVKGKVNDSFFEGDPRFPTEVRQHLRCVYDACVGLNFMKPLQKTLYDQSIKDVLSTK